MNQKYSVKLKISACLLILCGALTACESVVNNSMPPNSTDPIVSPVAVITASKSSNIFIKNSVQSPVFTLAEEDIQVDLIPLEIALPENVRINGTIVYTDGDDLIFVDSQLEKRVVNFRSIGQYMLPKFSPDGKSLAFECQPVYGESDRRLGGIVRSVKICIVATSQMDHDVNGIEQIHTLSTPSGIPCYFDDSFLANDLDWAPVDQQIAWGCRYVEGVSPLCIVDTESNAFSCGLENEDLGNLYLQLEQQSERYNWHTIDGISWYPGDRWKIALVNDGQVLFYGVEDHLLSPLLVEGAYFRGPIAWAPDGESIAVVAYQHNAPLISIVNSHLQDHPVEYISLQQRFDDNQASDLELKGLKWSPDGKTILVAVASEMWGRGVRIYLLDLETGLTYFVDHVSSFRGFDWMP